MYLDLKDLIDYIKDYLLTPEHTKYENYDVTINFIKGA
tara:strand:- start:411 stop:524 length:114 start_codon:yes stop_codon:yes gene_type:complete